MLLLPTDLETNYQPVGWLKQWDCDQRILVYRLENAKRATVDTCADDIGRVLIAWPPDHTFRLMIDIRAPQAMITGYAMYRARQTAILRDDLTSRLAILTTSRLTAQIASMSLRALATGRRQRAIFTHEAAAVAWLLQDDTIPLSE